MRRLVNSYPDQAQLACSGGWAGSLAARRVDGRPRWARLAPV